MYPDPGRIHRLPPVLASQIAAGEVIERPASVVKELVENSLDAGAGRIRIDIEAAGSRLIRVQDDGTGIHPDDLALAVAPHSTSKIHGVEDLAAITSLGFRGEALASIAAVARLRIASRHGDRPAREMRIEPGMEPPPPAPVAHPAGTTIEVRDLFFNMPARRKFLRTEQTEFLHILELVKSLALSRPGLGIRLSHNDRPVFRIGADSSAGDRIGQIFGSGFADQACSVDEADASLRLHGVAGLAGAARSQSDRQYVFLNGRLIRDRRLNHALRSAYQERLSAGRYAPFLLYLEMDPADYDINVHPTKHEVRFRAGRDVHDFVYSAMRRSLEAARPATEWQPPGRTTPFAAAVEAAPGVAEAVSGYGSVTEAAVPVGRAQDPAESSPFGDLLGCVLDRYLLTATAGAFTVIDGRRARERLTRLELEVAENGREALAGRPLLLPESREVNAAQLAKLENSAELLAALAVDLGPVSPTRIQLRGLPSVLPAVDARQLLADLVECLTGTPAANRHRRLVELLAEHAGRAFEPAQAPALLRELSAVLARDRLPAPLPWKTLDAAGLAAWLEA